MSIDADTVIDWFDTSARDLPWRHPDTTAWAVLVSEVMLQQTPVSRVQPVWEHWIHRWPRPSDLAAENAGEVVRAWGKLGYPRRALRLHATATTIAQEYDDEVPSDVDTLLTLPGVGTYTARAVAAFGYGHRTPVVDTNVRRVVARAVHGDGDAGPASTNRDLAEVQDLLPHPAGRAAHFCAALMELGALICTARSPKCASCPILESCRWQHAGKPAYTGPAKPTQRYVGTDRYVRGLLLDVLRGTDDPVDKVRLDIVWSQEDQRERCLDSLLRDGLVERTAEGAFVLPGEYDSRGSD